MTAQRAWSMAGMIDDAPGTIDIVLIDVRWSDEGDWLLFEDDNGNFWKSFESVAGLAD